MADGDGCQLMIVLEVGDAAAAAAQLAAALAAAPVASVVLEPAPGASLDAAGIEPLVELAQSKGAAALVSADTRLARTLKADGVHLPWSRSVVADLEAARGILGSRFIAGADAGRSRDDAMALGERGADYVGFGVPAEVKEQEKARERRLDLVAWWGEIFELPGVALDVADADEAAALAGAGADFVALRLAPGDGAADVAARVAAFAAAIAGVSVTA